MITRPEPAARDVWASYARRRDVSTHDAAAALDAVTRQYDLGDISRAVRMIDEHVAKHQIAPRHAWWCPWHHVPLDDAGMCPRRVAWPYDNTDAEADRAQRRLDRMVGLVDAADRETVDILQGMEVDGEALRYQDTVMGRITSLEETEAGLAMTWEPNDAGREWLKRQEDAISDMVATNANLADPFRVTLGEAISKAADKHAEPAWGNADTITSDVPSDDVDHPPHYGGADDPYEPIKIIEAKRLGFHDGNALKYLLRAGHKPGESRAKDLRKAAWYLQRLADHLEGDQ